MLDSIFNLLDRIASGLEKPYARITVEIHNMGDELGLKFQFLWYEDKIIKISVWTSKRTLNSAQSENTVIKHIIDSANYEINKYYKEKEKQDDDNSSYRAEQNCTDDQP